MNNKERALIIVRYGLNTSAILLLFSFLLPVLGTGIGLVQNLLFIVVAAEIILCCNEYKRKSEQPLTYRQAFSIGWQMSFVAGLTNALIILLAVMAIGEDVFRLEILKYKSMIMAQGKVDEVMAEQLVGIISNPWFLFCATITFYLMIGFILSIIIAFFVKTPPTSTKNEEQY